MHAVYGHDLLRERLGSSIASGRFPQAALFVGPPGVGKQRLALWTAQTLLCDASDNSPCYRCPSCVQIGGLAHPDVHWFVPLALKKKASDPEKQIEEIQKALADVMAERRKNSVYDRPEPTASHSLASVRLIHRIAGKKPFQGRHKVIIIGDAPRLVVQAGSVEAANALLKVLEEPPADTVIILTAESAHSLIPTIRSRCTPVRIRPVSTEAVVSFVTEVSNFGGKAANSAANLAGGRIGAVVQSKNTGSVDEATALIKSLRDPTSFLGIALKQAPFGARGGFSELLDALSARMRGKLAEGAEAGSPDLAKPLQALKIIDSHRIFTRQNVNPQLALAVMATELSKLR
jgi:DNA polymerase-3 subunit delta'